MLLRRVALFLTVALLLIGCKSPQTGDEPIATGPDYGRPLPSGASALRLITDSRRLPDLVTAYEQRDALLLDSLDESLRWFAAPSSRQFFPFEGITHEQGRASVLAMRELLQNATSAYDFRNAVLDQFDVYESVGYNGDGVVLFTGYYSPVFQASRERTEQFRYPLYRRPADLATDPITGEPHGRETTDGSIVPYYTREEIETSRMFAGDELVWLDNPLSVYVVHINGSAKLRLRDGSVMYIGYAGKTDRSYHGLGQSFLDEGLANRNNLSLNFIEDYARKNPQHVQELIYRNQNYVFFTEYAGGNWPAGSLGVRVTSEASLATDKKIYPRGGVVLVDTESVTFSRGKRRFQRFLMDQDTGGAIQAPGRADIFMGIGPTAEILAGGQYAEGRLYYFFLKPQHVPGAIAAVETQ